MTSTKCASIECDVQIERTLTALTASKAPPQETLAKARSRTQQPNALSFDARSAMYQLAGVDLTQIHGISPCLAVRLVAECGTDLSRWPSAKHFTSWLTLVARLQGQRREGAVVTHAQDD